MQETRTERCGYGYKDRLIDRLAKFGWQYSSKRLLNRYGNPFPMNYSISEAEKRQRCFLDVVFVRDLKEGVGPQVNSLEDEYNSLTELETSFTAKRISALIFLTFVLSVFLLLGCLDCFIFDNELLKIEGIIFFVLAGVVFLLMGLIIWMGIVHIRRNYQNNDIVNSRKQEILTQVGELLNKKTE